MLHGLAADTFTFEVGAHVHPAAFAIRHADDQRHGVSHRYYVEQCAAHPDVVGTEWFEWVDEPVSGRFDGENYNIGIVDVTDQPYAELLAAAQETHRRLLHLHAGKLAPVTRKAKISD